MEDNISHSNPLNQPVSHAKRSHLPRTLGILLLASAHIAFFLPFRVLVPVPAGTDPWWGLALALADGAGLMILGRSWLRRVRERKIPSGDG